MRHTPFPANEDLVYSHKCPLCNCDTVVDLGTPVEHESTPLRYVNCKNCSLIYMNPRPSQAWYNNLYQKEFWEVKHKKKRRQFENQIVKEARWADKFISMLDSCGFGENRIAPKVLEIGCAYGVIGKVVAANYSGRSYGVEPNDSARRIAENVTGVEIFATNMDDVIACEKSDFFDLIIFSHVLENITNPLASLQAAKRLLKDDGYLLIDTPNNFVRRSWHIHHPYCYTKPSLELLLNKAGFKIIETKVWPRPKYIIGSIYLTVMTQKHRKEIQYEGCNEGKASQHLVGSILLNLFNRGKIGKFNRLLAVKRWRLSKTSEEEVKRIKSIGQNGF
jgi:SAM-dependent methyltransferase